MLIQPRQPLPRIFYFSNTGISVIPESEESVNHRFRKFMGGPNLAETKHLVNVIQDSIQKK